MRTGGVTGSRAVAGRYHLLDQVGAGATGTVWRAWDRRERRFVAAKLLGRDGVVADPLHDPLLLRFVREQGLRVQHPHVLSPTGWAAEDERVVFTMQLVRGGTLEQLLAERGPLPPAYVAVLLEQLLSALVAVHAAGLVHRDVKPANLLLEPTGTGRPHLLLGDFGAATRLAEDERLTRVPGWVGTEGYVAPEARTGAPPDVLHDLYAAGVVASLALTGRRAGRPSAHADHGLAAVVAALTAEDPDRRPADAATALRLLQAARQPAGQPTAATWDVGGPCVPERIHEAGPLGRVDRCMACCAAPGTHAGSVAADPTGHDPPSLRRLASARTGHRSRRPAIDHHALGPRHRWARPRVETWCFAAAALCDLAAVALVALVAR